MGQPQLVTVHHDDLSVASIPERVLSDPPCRFLQQQACHPPVGMHPSSVALIFLTIPQR